jgi:signal transduction histidine kinase
VLANLVLNACEAVLPESGQIIITTLVNRDCLRLSVWDNGPGIPEEIHESMFLPFVSYGKTNGHGLGLAIAKTLIVQHGGEIYFDANCDTGKQFVILVPLAASAGTVPICH